MSWGQRHERVSRKSASRQDRLRRRRGGQDRREGHKGGGKNKTTKKQNVAEKKGKLSLPCYMLC